MTATDVTGNPVLQVWVILAENTPAEALGHATFQPFADDVRAVIRAAVQSAHVGVFQHVRFLLESEESGLVPQGAEVIS